MTSDIDQTLDELLQGVNALLDSAPSPMDSPVPNESRERGISESIEFGGTELGQLITMLALLESRPEQPASQLARKLLIQVFLRRARPLGGLAREYGTVMVSPVIHGRLDRLLRKGASVVGSDASTLTMAWGGGTVAELRSTFGRLFSIVCLEQTEPSIRFRVPKLPERVSVKLGDTPHRSSLASVGYPNCFAFIDQDNLLINPVTVLWLDGGAFVPDQICGMTCWEGEWICVSGASAD